MKSPSNLVIQAPVRGLPERVPAQNTEVSHG